MGLSEVISILSMSNRDGHLSNVEFMWAKATFLEGYGVKETISAKIKRFPFPNS